MRPVTFSQTGTGTSNWIPLDYRVDPFNVGFGCVVSGTVSYSIEHTYDDIFDPNVTPTAFVHSTVTAKAANAEGNYTTPVRAIRINVASGTGTVTCTAVQSGK